MEIIPLPVAFKKCKAEPTSQNKMLLGGPLKFSCDCGHQSEIHLNGVIFRYMDFYCSECGTHYKVTNPAFVNPIPKKK